MRKIYRNFEFISLYCFLKCFLFVVDFVSELSTVEKDIWFPGKEIALKLLQIISLSIMKQWGAPNSDENGLSEVNLLEGLGFFSCFSAGRTKHGQWLLEYPIAKKHLLSSYKLNVLQNCILLRKLTFRDFYQFR